MITIYDPQVDMILSWQISDLKKIRDKPTIIIDENKAYPIYDYNDKYFRPCGVQLDKKWCQI